MKVQGGWENLGLRGFYFGERPSKKEKTFLTVMPFLGIMTSAKKIKPTRPKKW